MAETGFELDYWTVAVAVEDDVGEGSSMVSCLTIELEKDYPQFDWANVMTDSWPLEPGGELSTEERG